MEARVHVFVPIDTLVKTLAAQVLLRARRGECPKNRQAFLLEACDINSRLEPHEVLSVHWVTVSADKAWEEWLKCRE